MTHDLKEELARLLEVRTMPNFERRRRRLEGVPLDMVAEALNRARFGLPLTKEQYIASHLGFLPGELEEVASEKISSIDIISCNLTPT